MTTEISSIDQVLTPGWVIDIMQAAGYKFDQLQDDGVMFNMPDSKKTIRIKVTQSEPKFSELVYLISAIAKDKGKDEGMHFQSKVGRSREVDNTIRNVEDLSRE